MLLNNLQGYGLGDLQKQCLSYDISKVKEIILYT